MMIGAVLYAKEMSKLARFYEGLGFEVMESDPTFCRLEHSDTELSVIQAPAPIADSITLSSPVEMRSSTPIKLVFVVPSIVVAAKTINASGGRIDRGQDRWELGRFYVQDAVDPEGNIIQLREKKSQETA